MSCSRWTDLRTLSPSGPWRSAGSMPRPPCSTIRPNTTAAAVRCASSTISSGRRTTSTSNSTAKRSSPSRGWGSASGSSTTARRSSCGSASPTPAASGTRSTCSTRAQPGWQFVAGSLDAHSTAWGGDGNHRKDYPLKLAGICVDRPQVGFVGKGRLWIDDAAVVRVRPSVATPFQVETQSPRFGNLYAVGDTVTLRASGAGDRVRWGVTDFFGRSVAQGEGAAGGTEARFTLGQPGWFSCRLELLAGWPRRQHAAVSVRRAARRRGTGPLGLRRRVQSLRAECLSAGNDGLDAALRHRPVPRRDHLAQL